MTKITDIPAIRFNGFSDTWEQRKVTEIGKIYIGLVTTMTKHYTDEGTLLIRNSDIKDGKFEFGDNPIYLEKTFAEKNETRMHQIGDVITVHTGDVGTSAVITENEAKSIGFATIVTRPNPKIIDSNYLCSFLNTDKHKKWAVSISTGDGRTNYNLGDYFELVVPVPSIAEQKKIASYIQKLNRLITLHQRKYDKLTNVKKSMLEKMFPQNGSNVPEIRFKGFTEAWEQRKVSELFRVTRGYVLAATQTETTKTDEKPYPVYSSQTKDKGLMGYYKDYLYEDAITWTTDGANAGTVNYRAGKFYCTNVCGVLLSNEVKANQMIAEALNSVAKGYVSYVGNPKLMNNVMADIVIQIPTQAEEREQLSSFFAKLDNLITLHQRELEKLKNLKKACLEKMFV